MLFIQKKFKLIVSFSIILLLSIAFSNQPKITAYASNEMPGYENPRDIIIATPKNNYSTTGSKVSILGACDYEYPLYMNGEEIETTEYGFFTVYVELEVGKNECVFENNGIIKTLTINRKKVATSSGNNSGNSGTSTPKVTYKEFKNDVYGVITSSYAMPRSKVSDSNVNLMPLTLGTTSRILGEDGSFYKLADGTFVSKSSIRRYDKKLESNKVTKANMSIDSAMNQLVIELSMNVNALYSVSFEGQNIYLKLYDTIAAAKPKTAGNDIIEKVTVNTDSKNKTKTYCFTMYDNASVYGYDVTFKNGVMRFELKLPVKLKDTKSLTGATIVLDAGHGDYDSGTVGPMGVYGPVEKDINLNITLYTKQYLEALGAKVILIRENDTFYSLSNRVETIRKVKPDLSVSIHGNSLDYSSDYGKTSGFLTYYSYNLFGNLPNLINNSITEELGFNKREPRQKSLSLTRFTTCPSVLLETSFLSNPYDYEYLIQTENQKDFGIAIGKSIQNYLQGVAKQNDHVYVVKRGDTLASIASKYGITIKQLAEYNSIENINYIVVGQKILIP